MGILEALSLGVVILTGVYFLGLGVLSFIRADVAARFFLGFAANAKLHYLELAIRLAVGIAFILAAGRLQYSTFFSIFGWILTVTTAVMLLVPWQTHRRFAERSVPSALRFLKLIGFSSIVAGAAIVAAAVL